ncbi:hypothetical protein D3C81_1413280 [compost metagenome]
MPSTYQIRHINMSNLLIDFDVRKRFLHPFVLELGLCCMYHFKIQMWKTFSQKRYYFHTLCIFTRVIVTNPSNSNLFSTFSGVKYCVVYHSRNYSDQIRIIMRPFF